MFDFDAGNSERSVGGQWDPIKGVHQDPLDVALVVVDADGGDVYLEVGNDLDDPYSGHHLDGWWRFTAENAGEEDLIGLGDIPSSIPMHGPVGPVEIDAGDGVLDDGLVDQTELEGVLPLGPRRELDRSAD